MHHRVAVKEIGETDQGGGVSTPSKTTVDTVWGSFEPLSSNQYLYAQQSGHAISHRVKVWDPIYKSGGTEFIPTTDCELEIDSRTLHVVDVRREEEKTRSVWIFDVVEKAD